MKNDCAIWWLSSNDVERIDTPPADWPEYMRSQLESLHGRAGRGRLWTAAEFGELRVDPGADWDSPLGCACAKRGGIVIRGADIALLVRMPGLVTDFRLCRRT